MGPQIKGSRLHINYNGIGNNKKKEIYIEIERAAYKILRKHRIDIKQNKSKRLKVGDIFSQLTILEINCKKIGGSLAHRCECECGKQKYIIGNWLKSGMSKNCGCAGDISKHPYEYCRLAGIESVAELSRISGVSSATLISWYKKKPMAFRLLVRGAANEKVAN